MEPPILLLGLQVYVLGGTVNELMKFLSFLACSKFSAGLSGEGAAKA